VLGDHDAARVAEDRGEVRLAVTLARRIDRLTDGQLPRLQEGVGA